METTPRSPIRTQHVVQQTLFCGVCGVPAVTSEEIYIETGLVVLGERTFCSQARNFAHKKLTSQDTDTCMAAW